MGRLTRTLAVTGALLALALTNGCAYMHKRGNDAMDILDIGITVNDQLAPRFALYVDFFNVLPIGYSNVDGKTLGMGNRQAGFLDFVHKNWGVLTVGEEQKGTGVFNPNDPHQARPDQSTLTERPRFDVGISGIDGAEPPPKLQYFECDRALHLGWIGFHATIRPLDIVDFVLGWAAADMMHDDDIDTPR